MHANLIDDMMMNYNITNNCTNIAAGKEMI